MKNKIINIIIFAVAILDCILALVFAFRFDTDKKDNFIQEQQVQNACPALINDLQAATPETLSKVVETYQTDMRSFGDSLNAVQLQKDILYTYLQDLKNLDETSFDAYKAGFADRAEGLFAKCDKKQEYVDGFNQVGDFKSLESYINKVEKEYLALKQSYLLDKQYQKAANGLISKADQINTTASETKKANDLQALQDDLKQFKSNAKLENVFILIAYLLGGVTLFLMLFFALTRIVKEFRTSYKILIVLALFAVIVFIGYAIGSPVLTPNAIKAGLTSTGFKMVNAAAFTLYVTIFGAILAILVTSIVSAVKNRK